jgi:hypothetical protein
VLDHASSSLLLVTLLLDLYQGAALHSLRTELEVQAVVTTKEGSRQRSATRLLVVTFGSREIPR